MPNKVQMRRGVRGSLPALAPGEFGLCTDTMEIFIGGPAGNIRVSTVTDVDSLNEALMQVNASLSNKATIDDV